MKKLLMVSLAAFLLLTGCHSEHDWIEATCTQARFCVECDAVEGVSLGHNWTEATCTTPKTCVRCEETEGTALSHNWLPATCDSSKACNICGVTEGDPLPHDLTAANYQEAAICNICSGLLEEPLAPKFLSFNYRINDINTPVRYKSTTSNIEIETIAEVTLTDFIIIDGNDKYTKKDGYEWRIARFSTEYSDMNAINHGMKFTSIVEDYYTIDGENVKITVPSGANTTVINYYGEDIAINYTEEVISAEWRNSVFYLVSEAAFLVPVGYDGILIACYNPANNIRYVTGDDNLPLILSELIDADTIWFRLG